MQLGGRARVGWSSSLYREHPPLHHLRHTTATPWESCQCTRDTAHRTPPARTPLREWNREELLSVPSRVGVRPEDQRQHGPAAHVCPSLLSLSVSPAAAAAAPCWSHSIVAAVVAAPSVEFPIPSPPTHRCCSHRISSHCWSPSGWESWMMRAWTIGICTCTAAIAGPSHLLPLPAECCCCCVAELLAFAPPRTSPAPSSIKPGKVVIVLAGRYAGRKAIVVKTFDDATKEHKFGHALIAGIDKVRRANQRQTTNRQREERERHHRGGTGVGGALGATSCSSPKEQRDASRWMQQRETSSQRPDDDDSPLGCPPPFIRLALLPPPSPSHLADRFPF